MDKEWNIKIGGLKESAKDFDKLKKSVDDGKNSLEGQNKTVGDYSKAIREASKEIKTIQGEMLGLEKGSKAWTELAKKAGDYKDRIDDIREATKRYASDTKQLDDVINLAQSATAAFTLYKGAMSAFGVETENAEKALTELAGAMSIIQSLQTLNNTLKGSSATAELFNTVMKATGAQLVQNQLAAIKATAAQEGLTTAQKVGAVASKTLGLAMKAIPLMFIIGLVATLITHWEDLVGWFEKTFPALKKMGGAMNALKGVIVGVGKAVVHWLVNPFETFAKVIKKIIAGDFAGAVEEAVNGVKNQFTGLGKAFKEGFQDQVESGMEEMSRKAAAEMDKTLTHQKNMITKQKNADGTYRKEYIEANKKMFANRKKMYKKDSDEYRKVLEEEAQFFQQVEDAKESAAKKSASERAKANKEAAKAAADAAKKEQEEAKALLDSRRALRNEIQNTSIIEQKALERMQSLRLEGYDTGPIEKYIEELEKLREIQSIIYTKELSLTIASIGDYLEDNIKSVKKTSAEWQTFLATLQKENLGVIDTLGLEKKEVNLVLAEWQKVEGLKLKASDDSNAQMIENYKKMLSVVKGEMAEMSDDFQKRYKLLIDKVNAIGNEKVERDKIFGVINTGKTLANLEILKAQWEEAYVDLSKIVSKEEERWNQYLENVKNIYGEDSSAFKKAQKEKADALDPLIEKLNEVAKRANTPTSTETDYTGDNNAGASTKPQRKLWYGKGDKKQDGSEYSLIDNLANMFDSLDEMVLAPAMDTFSMFMDFAIEETAQKLEEVQEMHDKALDKVNESADKIKELNESLKDSSNDNMDVTKQQLADEELLYAQRLAEERKLADQEKALKNKQAQQEANARKMELRYQMVMAIANTAQGASKALATWGWPLGAVFAGIMAALGAIQVALIAKQIGAIKPVKYAEGGIISGKPHSQGGERVGNTNIEVEGGEMVVSKKNTERYKDVLYKINNNDPSVRYLQGNKGSYADTKIRKYASGGELNFDRADESLRTQQDTNKLMSAIDGINMNPIVTVKDIWKAEDRLVKVRGLAGR